MFELARELKRLFRPRGGFAPPRDGLAAGDPGLLELLDVPMLKAEAKAADVAAGRVGVRDRSMLQLRQALTWRELARRTGDAAALRKAAAAAEAALSGVTARQRPEAFARIRLEQAACALLGVELHGDEGLAAAAGQVLAEAIAAAPASAAAAQAAVLRAQVLGAGALSRGDPDEAMALAQTAAGSLASLDAAGNDRLSRRAAAIARLRRAELVAACGVRLRDVRVLEEALTETVRAGLSLDAAYEPVSFSRAAALQGEILTAMGETTAEPLSLQRAVDVLTGVFDHLPRDHSPADWAGAQYRLGRAMVSLAELTGRTETLRQARLAFERVLSALSEETGHPLRASAAQAKGLALAREAELSGDRMALDAAEAAFRCELAAADPLNEPVAWAVCQVSLAQVYLSRLAMTGQDRGERARAAVALDMALDVFAEHGCHTLSAIALSGLERLRATA